MIPLASRTCCSGLVPLQDLVTRLDYWHRRQTVAATMPAQIAPNHPLAELGVSSVDGGVVVVVLVVVVVAAGRTGLLDGLKPIIAYYRGQ